MHYSIAFKHHPNIGRPPLGEILYPPLTPVTNTKGIKLSEPPAILPDDQGIFSLFPLTELADRKGIAMKF